MVSMKEIARSCGVSVATVSKALSDKADISKATRDKVRKVAEEMGYTLNASARALKTNRTYNIGVLFVDSMAAGLAHEYFSEILESFKKAAEEYANQDFLTHAVSASSAEMDAAKAKVDELTRQYEEQEGVVGDLNAAYDTASRTVKGVGDDMTALDERAAETGTHLQTAAAGVEGALDDVQGAAKQTGDAIVQAFDVEAEINSAVSRVEEIIKAYDDKLAARTGTLQNWFEVNATVSKEDASFDSLNTVLDKQIADMQEWSDGIARLEKEGIDQNFLDKLKDAGPASLEYVKTLLNAYAKKWREAYEGAAKTAEEQLKAMHDASNEEIAGILKDAEDRGADFESVFNGLGVNAADGYIEALRGKLDEVKAAAQELAAATSGTVEEELDINSPSKVMRKIGEYTGEGFTLGIEDEVSSAVKASKELIDSVVGASQSAVKSAELAVPDMSAATQTMKSYRAAQLSSVDLQSSANTGDTATAVKQALNEIVSGNVEIVTEMDGDRFARTIVPKIDLLQGQKLIEVEGGYASV